MSTFWLLQKTMLLRDKTSSFGGTQKIRCSNSSSFKLNLCNKQNQFNLDTKNVTFNFLLLSLTVNKEKCNI
jgi:hypothetical protein